MKYVPEGSGVRRGIAFFLILFLLMSGASALAEKPNVLLITIDTIRRDHLSCYGYGRETTPNIDRLAQESVLFSNSVSVIPLTTPSHATIMTGLHPATHQVFRNSYPVSERFAMMAEILRKGGYDTGGFVSVRIIESRIGFGQGFDFFSDVNPQQAQGTKGSTGEMERRGDITTDIAIKWLNEHVYARFFAWVHLYDPHLPYIPPDEYGYVYNEDYPAYLEKIRNPAFRREAFADQHEPVGGEQKKPVRKKPGLIEFFDRIAGLDREFLTPRRFTPDLVGQMRSAYDSEILFSDEQVGRILNLLKEKGVYDKTVIVVVGDHGEILHEKKEYFGHHRHLYEGSLIVPLIMKFPGIEQKRVNEPVTTVDILPTLLDAVGLENREKMDGVSYWPLLRSGADVEVPDHRIFATHCGIQRPRPEEKKIKYPALRKGARKIKAKIMIFSFKVKRKLIWKRRWDMDMHFHKFAIVRGDWKLIRIRTSFKKRDVEYELYNLADDPEENNNLSRQEEDVVKKLGSLLKKYIGQRRKPIVPEQLLERTEEQKKQDIKTLKSLGYM